MAILEPSDLHAATAAAFNRGDVDALVALYEPDACLIEPGGEVASGHAEIRRVWQDFVALGGTMSMVTRYCCQRGVVALMSNTWEFASEHMTLGATSAEVAAQGPDGEWRYAIDNPLGGVVGQT